MAALARRIASTLATTVLVIGVMAPAASAGSLENEALSLLNGERAAAGLAPVSLHADLNDDALGWSQHMMAAGSLSHNPNLASVTTGWDKLGENVGLGTSIPALHDAFMNSAGHRGNVLGDYDYVGIAVVEETSSKLWITVVFMKSIGSAGDDEPEPYSEVQPAVDNDQPSATSSTARPVAETAATPTPRPHISFVQSGVAPLAA